MFTYMPRVRAWGRMGRPVIADNLSKAGWSWGCVATVDREGRTIWIADAHRGEGKRFVVRADEKRTAFMELEAVIESGLGRDLARRQPQPSPGNAFTGALCGRMK